MKSSKQVRSAKGWSSRTAAQTRREAGAAAVEFMLVLPILLALIFGMVNFGFIFAAQISLNSSARDAARAGVVNPLTGSAMTCYLIAEAGRRNSATIGVTPVNVGVTVKNLTTGGLCTLPVGSNPSSIPSGDSLLCTGTGGQLSVVLTYNAVSPAPLVPPSSATLSATGVFQCEYL